jgi:tetratricopeptide (TPR) repeat protein
MAMEILLLDEAIQSKIDELIDGAWDNFQSDKDDEKYLKTLKKAWELYPEPKEKWSESYNTAKYIFEGYMDIKNFDEAKKWLEKMTKINDAYRAWDKNSGYDEELDFETGKYYYETGNLEEAYKLWREVVRRSGKNHFRFFENEDKKYLEYYKTQKKLHDKN